MSTRSRIGVIRKSGKVESVYCHFDGYPSGVGIDNLSTEAYNYLFDEQTETWSFSSRSDNNWIPLNQEAIDKD